MFRLKIKMCQLKTTNENKGHNSSADVVCAPPSTSVFRCFANFGPHALSVELHTDLTPLHPCTFVSLVSRFVSVRLHVDLKLVPSMKLAPRSIPDDARKTE